MIKFRWKTEFQKNEIGVISLVWIRWELQWKGSTSVLPGRASTMPGRRNHPKRCSWAKWSVSNFESRGEGLSGQAPFMRRA